MSSDIEKLSHWRHPKVSCPYRAGGLASFSCHALAARAIITTRQLAEIYDDWPPETLADRQPQMARQATAIWRIAQLT
jgi:hypothetical protein